VDQISGTTPAAGPTEPQDEDRSDGAGNPTDRSEIGQPGFGTRGRMRRRARFLRKARELAYRDLGGLVFNLHRYSQRNDPLVIAKLATLGHIDAELRALETTLGAQQPVTVLREAGITACARCAAIHSSEDRFCPNCGLSMGRHADLPIAGAPATPAASGPPVPQASPAPASGATPAPARAPESTAAAPRLQTPTGGRSPIPASTPATPSPASTPTPSPPPGATAPPIPPGGAAAPPGVPPAQAEETSPGADEPTEILHPPRVGQ
jgi:hypothetical protein